MEAAYLLGTEEPLLQMLVDGDITSFLDLDAHAAALLDWLRKYSDMDPGLADACIVRMAEVTPRAEILTTGRRDFSTYRSLTGKPLRCLFPPADCIRVAVTGGNPLQPRPGSGLWRAADVSGTCGRSVR